MHARSTRLRDSIGPADVHLELRMKINNRLIVRSRSELVAELDICPEVGWLTSASTCTTGRACLGTARTAAGVTRPSFWSLPDRLLPCGYSCCEEVLPSPQESTSRSSFEMLILLSCRLAPYLNGATRILSLGPCPPAVLSTHQFSDFLPSLACHLQVRSPWRVCLQFAMSMSKIASSPSACI